MANDDLKVKDDVVVELHKAFALYAQSVFDKTGIKISSVNFNWQPTGFGAHHARLVEVSVDTLAGVLNNQHINAGEVKHHSV